MINHINYYGLYVYGELALDAVSKAKAFMTPFLSATQGAEWFADLGEATKLYRDLVDSMIQEQAETSQAVRELNAAFDGVSVWRNAMFYFAQNAAPAERRLMLKAAGYGLGAIDSPKHASEFLARVQALIEPLGDKFTALGADPRMISFPREQLQKLDVLQKQLRDEKADDTMLRSSLRQHRKELVERFNSVERAAKAAAAQQQIFDPGAANPALRLVEDLQESLSQAIVQVHSKAKDSELPGVLTAEDPATTDSGPGTSASDQPA